MPNEIIINKRVDLKQFHNLLVVAIETPALGPNLVFTENDMTVDEKFWTKSLLTYNYFKNIVPISNLDAFLNANGYQINNDGLIYDAADLKPITYIYGNFLLLEITNT